MNTLLKAAVLGISVAGLAACGADPRGGAGFTLPEGDVEQGKANYVAFGCNACHDHAEVPKLDAADTEGISVTIGGESARVRTYGELVTSIINPSHRVARRGSEDVSDEAGNSKMVTFNDFMTVTELIDLVAFVQSSYTLSPYQNSAYPVYWYPTESPKKK
jgi:L-cysteine S-thiosulfotransferase